MRPGIVRSVLASGLLTLGCSDSTTEPVASVVTGPAFVNATAIALDFDITGAGTLANVRPSVAIAMPAGLSAGTHQAAVRIAGSITTLALLSFEVTAANPTHVIAFGTGSGITARALEDTGSIVPAGKSKVRVINLAPGSDIDIWRTQPDYQTGIRFQFPFPYDPEPGPYLQSDAGAWRVWITPTSDANLKLYDTGPFQVPSGERRTVVVVDSAGALRLRVLVE